MSSKGLFPAWLRRLSLWRSEVDIAFALSNGREISGPRQFHAPDTGLWRIHEYDPAGRQLRSFYLRSRRRHHGNRLHAFGEYRELQRLYARIDWRGELLESGSERSACPKKCLIVESKLGAGDGRVGDLFSIQKQYLAATRFRDGNITRIGAKAWDTGKIDDLSRAFESATNQ